MSGISPVNDSGPIVPRPRIGIPISAVIAACLTLGASLFTMLEGKRRQQAPQETMAADGSATHLAPQPPPLEIPAPPPDTAGAPAIYRAIPAPALTAPVQKTQAVGHVRARVPVAAPVPTPMPMTMPPPPPPPPARMQEPALVIDLTESPPAGSADDTARATVMRHRSMVVVRGTIIPAVLETPINSSTPGIGLVRAIASKDIRSFDETRVLIPKGSRLFGEYQSGVKSGQSRVWVNWTTLVRPDGVSVHLNSPAADARGAAGIPGHVNNHTFARIASAVLQSVLSFGGNYAYRPTGGGTVVVGAPAQAAAEAGGALLPNANADPVLTVKEGADIAVMVAHDLDFSGALPRQ